MTISGKGPEALAQQVFISYSNENENDRPVADKIYDALKARGISCWAAHRDIPAGEKWATEISKAIDNSRVMIVVLSEHTEKSSFVGKEVTLASNINLTIIPFCIEKVSLSGSLKFLLSDCQWINAYLHPWDKALEQLVVNLHRQLGIEPGDGKGGSHNSVEYEKKRPRVFLCHASEDKEIANTLHGKLKEAGLDPWLDKENLRGGDRWDDMIQKVIKNEIDYFLVVQSKSLKQKKKGYVNKEIYEALEQQKLFQHGIRFIIPLIIDESGILERLEAFHAISIDSEHNIEELIRVIESDYKKRGETCERVEKLPQVDKVPDYIRFLNSKGWDVKKNEKDSWEAFKKTYDLTMVYIPPGKFIMGADDGDNDERPQHEVDLDDYWIGKYEVTFAQYDQYCDEIGKEKPDDKGWGRGNRPVIHVPYDDAAAYCVWLSRKTELIFKLPTEAQWEKAARGTGGFVYPWGNHFDKNKCNSKESGLGRTSPVGTYPSGKSTYGCMDMAGNVWEWCSDWYDSEYYKISPAKNPQGPVYGSARVLRGGGWFGVASNCRAASRHGHPAGRGGLIGFRLVMII